MNGGQRWETRAWRRGPGDGRERKNCVKAKRIFHAWGPWALSCSVSEGARTWTMQGHGSPSARLSFLAIDTCSPSVSTPVLSNVPRSSHLPRYLDRRFIPTMLSPRSLFNAGLPGHRRGCPGPRCERLSLGAGSPGIGSTCVHLDRLPRRSTRPRRRHQPEELLFSKALPLWRRRQVTALSPPFSHFP